MTSWGWAMMLIWTTLLVFLVVGVTWAILAASRPTASAHDAPLRSDGSPPRTARELLDARLATGDIDLDEYEKRRGALERPLMPG